MALRILGANVSPFVRKVRVFCAEKGISYELELMNPFTPPEGWRLQPEPALYPKEPTTARERRGSRGSCTRAWRH